jgi:maleate isomerase
MTCEPDYLVMGISALSFLGGMKGADGFAKRISDDTGLGVTIGSHATASAIAALGGIRRIGVLTPYWPVMNAEVKRYFEEAGFEVVCDIALKCRSWTGIAAVTPIECRDAIRQLDGDDIDAIVQVGTNLSMVRVAAAAELWLGKPVIAINTATYWHALREWHQGPVLRLWPAARSALMSCTCLPVDDLKLANCHDSAPLR